MPTRTSTFTPPPSEEIKAYWGTSPRGLIALRVEVWVNGERRIRGYEEFHYHQETPESLAKRLQKRLRSDVEEAGLPVTALLTERTRLGEELLLNAPKEVLIKALPSSKLDDIVFSQMKGLIKAKGRKQTEFDICQAEAEVLFLAEVGRCAVGDIHAKAVGRFIMRPVIPEEMRNLAAKFEVTCIAEPDKPSIQCFDSQSGQMVKEWKL